MKYRNSRYEIAYKYLQEILYNPKINKTNLMYNVNVSSSSITYIIKYFKDNEYVETRMKQQYLTHKGQELYAKLSFLIYNIGLEDFHIEWHKTEQNDIL